MLTLPRTYVTTISTQKVGGIEVMPVQWAAGSAIVECRCCNFAINTQDESQCNRHKSSYDHVNK
jgi:hypothetical protein